MSKRTIKFKGKCISPEFKGKTACGSLLTFPDGTARIFEYSHDKVFNYYSVDADTVCQFTGLLDKNGKEIYDGDIIAHNGKVIGHIVDGVRGYCFDVVYANPVSTSTWSLYGVVVNDYEGDVEIVGSIHDKEWQQKLNIKNE